ncbi:hypothetical protein Syun_003638 [Stephania yunnanensis]|uniref:Aminotransferase-like plant mobile domain-containing protein n=1 Tax=Stephania yunnanensis TaxID=152371 RepID=A0AAP0L1U3_9MAGN
MDYVHPRVCGWIQKHETVANVDKLGSMRRTLDRLRPSEVTWDPYVNFRENGVVHAMTFYSGTIKYMDVVEPYYPERILRQFGHVQSIREDFILSNFGIVRPRLHVSSRWCMAETIPFVSVIQGLHVTFQRNLTHYRSSVTFPTNFTRMKIQHDNMNRNVNNYISI